MKLALSAERFADLLHSRRSVRKAVAVLASYVDGSNLHGGSDVVVVAAFVAETTVWTEWERRWGDLIAWVNRETKCKIDRWHHYGFMNKTDDFLDITQAEWLIARRMLLEVFAGTKPQGIVHAVFRADYEDVRAKASWPMPADPYYFLLDRVLSTLVHGIFAHPKDDGVLIYCDKDRDKALVLNLATWHEGYLRSMGHDPFHDSERPVVTTYGSSIDYVPIQAADIIAYEMMQSARARGSSVKLGGAIRPAQPIIEALAKSCPMQAMLHTKTMLEMEVDGRAFVKGNEPGYAFLPPGGGTGT